MNRHQPNDYIAEERYLDNCFQLSTTFLSVSKAYMVFDMFEIEKQTNFGSVI